MSKKTFALQHSHVFGYGVDVRFRVFKFLPDILPSLSLVRYAGKVP